LAVLVANIFSNPYECGSIHARRIGKQLPQMIVVCRAKLVLYHDFPAGAKVFGKDVSGEIPTRSLGGRNLEVHSENIA
jgi:hypothetical protein